MILCPVEDFRRYAALHPAFATVAECLERTDLDALPEGRTDPPGGGFHLSASPHARTRPAAEAPLEAHRAYIDVQVVLEGVDTLGWAPVAACREIAQPYDPAKDIVFFRDAPQALLQLLPGQLAVFFPEDAHAPLIGGGERIRKVVVKVPVQPC
jgi:YhcH/YjgK/YiaL family protein